MVYNFNLGIGWASSGVEYAQAYRARMLRAIGQKAKFVFTDMFSTENIEHMTKNIGFLDEEVIWLYTFFTDTHIARVSYTLAMLEETFPRKDFTFSRDGKRARYVFPGNNNFYTAYMVDETSDLVHRVEYVESGCLIRKDYFTYCRLYTEYYAPMNGKACLFQRRFFNEDGTVAYEEVIDGDAVMYRFPYHVFTSKEELVAHMVSCLKLSEEDVVLIDRTTDIGQPILANAKPARVGIIIHADHFSEGGTDETHILWNNYYEYAFAEYAHIDFYVTATEAQRKLLIEQFQKYKDVTPVVHTIPVGSIPQLIYPEEPRKKHALITASRLAAEKHIDWLIDAVARVHETYEDVTLDIYGKGGEENKLEEKIKAQGASSYIRLMGQHNLEQVYKKYEAYVAGSMSEGFGLTLLEAVGSGLPIIGFDVRYGNQTFIVDGKNGYLIPGDDKTDGKQRVNLLYESMMKLFAQQDLESFHQASYEKAKEFLTEEVEKKWAQVLA